MNQRQIIMNFSVPPSIEDIEVLASNALQTLPEELVEFCDTLAIRVEDIPDEALEGELSLEDPYELISLFRSGKQISPGVESKTANDEDVLLLFRRPFLDMWCETGEDLSILVRQILIEELGQNFDFSEDEIDEMSQRHHQGSL